MFLLLRREVIVRRLSGWLITFHVFHQQDVQSSLMMYLHGPSSFMRSTYMPMPLSRHTYLSCSTWFPSSRVLLLVFRTGIEASFFLNHHLTSSSKLPIFRSATALYIIGVSRLRHVILFAYRLVAQIRWETFWLEWISYGERMILPNQHMVWCSLCSPHLMVSRWAKAWMELCGLSLVGAFLHFLGLGPYVVCR